MKINKNNYEAFILDYFEGSLSEKQAEMLMSFLEENPELKKEFEEFEIIEIGKENIKYEEKEFLKKPEPQFKLPITPDNFEIFCIAEIEGLLSEKEISELYKFVSENPGYQKTHRAYSLAKVKPDTSIVFPFKSKLKKHFINTKTWYNVAAAATILLLTGLFLFDQITVERVEQQYVETPVKDSKYIEKPSDKTIFDEKIKPSDEIIVAEKTLKEVHIQETEQKETKQQKELEADESYDLIESQIPEIHRLAFVNPQQLPSSRNFGELITTEKPKRIQTKLQEEKDINYIDENYNSLPQMLVAQIEKRADQELALAQYDRFSAWDLAGAGLTAISQFSGNPLNIDTERNEQGEITYLAIGNNFSVSRSRRSE